MAEDVFVSLDFRCTLSISHGSSVTRSKTVLPVLAVFSTHFFTARLLSMDTGQRALMEPNRVTACPAAADTSFGPRVASCRRQFDFTILFEECVFSLAPFIIFVVFATLRFKVLTSERLRVCTDSLRRLKMVHFFFNQRTY